MTSRCTSLVLILLVGTQACGQELPPAADLRLHGMADTSPLYALGDAIWAVPFLNVCWEAPQGVPEEQWVRDAIQMSWSAVAGIRFIGWGQCRAVPYGSADDIHDIHLYVEDVVDNAPHSDGLGRTRGHRRIALNFKFDRWDPSWPIAAGSRKNAIQTIAIHEFGHALGFAHEQNRPDTDRQKCSRKPQGPDGDIMANAWDAHSIMNYCRHEHGHGLSEGDIVAAQQFYGVNQNLYFWERFYSAANEDVRHHVDENHRFAHFRKYGWTEHRMGTPWLDLDWIRQHGWACDPSDAGCRVADDWALIQWYASSGLFRGLSGSALWDPKYYLANNSDVADAVGPRNYAAALHHWREHGIDEGRAGSATFDPRAYLRRYPDLTSAFGADNYLEAIVHYLRYGRHEGRTGSTG